MVLYCMYRLAVSRWARSNIYQVILPLCRVTVNNPFGSVVTDEVAGKSISSKFFVHEVEKRPPATRMSIVRIVFMSCRLKRDVYFGPNTAGNGECKQLNALCFAGRKGRLRGKARRFAVQIPQVASESR